MKIFLDDGQFFRNKINNIEDKKNRNFLQKIKNLLNKEFIRTKKILTQEGMRTFKEVYKIIDIKEIQHEKDIIHIELFTQNNYTLHIYIKDNYTLSLQY